MALEPVVPPDSGDPIQRVVKVRRDYNTWVAQETLEDYALRFTPRSFRKWSELHVANTAFGASAFLVLEAVGATMLVHYGFVNTFWAVLFVGLVIFLTALPISLYAARHGVDMDLLTRGAGFGYIGSTISSLVYASFTFILFALEAAIMAYALELYFQMPPSLGYLICALVVIPLVTHGVTAISRLQVFTQPVWMVMLALPYVFVFMKHPQVLTDLAQYPGEAGEAGGRFDIYLFGAAVTVGVALITQIGEQVDYLRFMPERTKANRRRWLAGVLLGGPGWILPGVAKMLGGALLAYLAIQMAVPAAKAVDPNQMYLIGFLHVFADPSLALAATAIFVIISQLKINVTNAYAGSLAWSNFFARLTHSHPGRVVWVVFNTMIALMLMELDMFSALGQVLGLYSNIAISWIVAVVADLVVNKPMGWSPPGIEFRRAYLYDINPAGLGAMAAASLLSVSAFLGVFGPEARAFSPFIAFAVAFVVSPLVAWATGGRYYIARAAERAQDGRCGICGGNFEAEDMAHCPAYRGAVCSLCCSLDARCNDLCKPQARLAAQWVAAFRRVLPVSLGRYLDTGLGHYLMLMAMVIPALAILMVLLYAHEFLSLGEAGAALAPRLGEFFIRAFAALVLVGGIVSWWLVLLQQSRRVAMEESARQTDLLMREIELHRRTDEQLQMAKQAADAANQAKSRYITTISHELRTPLNAILGYAQILDGDQSIPEHRRRAVGIIRRSGDHLLSLIEGTLDIARIEGGKLTLDVKAMDFPECILQIVRMLELQAREKGIDFRYEPLGELPSVVRADERRLRQILINVLGNAVKFTERGSVVFRLRYAREMGEFEIEDSGPGIAPEELERIFEPFARGGTSAGGTGLGLTIAKMLTDLMGGEMTVQSEPGAGSLFRIRLFLPQVRAALVAEAIPRVGRGGYLGERRRVLVVDNESMDRALLADVLQPAGFVVAQAASGEECLAMLGEFRPHAIFMDLTMEGIDGWETIRRIRQGGFTETPIAVVSANVFDKGRGGELGIGAENFIAKPVRIGELLDWLGRSLGLAWQGEAEASLVPPNPPAPVVYPPPARLRALAEAANMGYLRGITKILDEIEADRPDYASFVAAMRGLAGQFRFEAMADFLREKLNEQS